VGLRSGVRSGLRLMIAAKATVGVAADSGRSANLDDDM
jgi:hypothetical protein